jgi:hypothetical protein
MTLTGVVFSPAALDQRREAVRGGHQRFLRGGRDPAGLPRLDDETQQGSGSAGDELCSATDSAILAVCKCFRTSVEDHLDARGVSGQPHRTRHRSSTHQRSPRPTRQHRTMPKVAAVTLWRVATAVRQSAPHGQVIEQAPQHLLSRVRTR